MSTYNLDSLSYIATRLYGGTPHAPDNTRGDGHDWTADALCAQVDPELWYPEKGGDVRGAKQLCNGNEKKGRPPCPVKAECLAYALERNERFGVWGGLSERDRRRLRKGAA